MGPVSVPWTWYGNIGVYLNPRDEGSVWVIDVGTKPETLVNSSVESLGWFLAECSRPRPEMAAGAPAEVRRKGLREIERRMRVIDPRAMREEADTLWPVVIEDALCYA